MPLIVSRLIIVLIALTLDLIIGDPQNPLHPIRIIGNGIAQGIKLYRKLKPTSKAVQFISGAVLSLLTIAIAGSLTWLLVTAVYQFNYWLGIAVEAVICYFLIAAKCLKVESMKVHDAIVADDIELARFNVSMIVGRDTANLTMPEITKAAVETVAENLSDGVIAPLLYIFIGGAPLGMTYKAINTLDSMIAYKTDEFLYFGKLAARLDDAANFIPSRLSGLLLIIGSMFVSADHRQATRVFIRDRKNHASPNSAQTISACAGALGLQLGGDTVYHGKLVSKPTIGDAQHPLTPDRIVAANKLMYAATFCLTGIFIIIAAAVGAVVWL
jgi:adenosylcobinamide-phosphate synthase